MTTHTQAPYTGLIRYIDHLTGETCRDLVLGWYYRGGHMVYEMSLGGIVRHDAVLT